MIQKTTGIAIILVPMLFLGCNGDTATTTNNSPTSPTTLVSKYTPDEGRLLASQCSQCHGTNGVSTNNWDSIAGEGNLHREMFEDDAPIMLAQAKGYSNSEITLIENYLTQFQELDENENNADDRYENDND